MREQDKLEWIDEYGWWLVYSSKLDGAFCVCCALFANEKERKNMGALINTPFQKWHHKSEIITKHSKKPSHNAALEAACAFIDSIEKPEQSLSAMLDKQRAANIHENRHILKCVAEAVLFCGRQCIALRGDSKGEHSGSNKNPENFLALLRLIASHDSQLEQHLQMPKFRNATYVSPEIQNEMIDIIGHKIIQARIVQEVKDAQIFTITVDEVTSHNTEMMPVCVRFVDKDMNIREELLDIVSLPRITGVHIANKTKEVLSKLEIELSNCRGQGYDGASNMRSERVGVQALIRQDAPKAVYMHCSGQCLNLAIAGSCAIPIIRTTLEKIKATVSFFIYSPKRESLLSEVAGKETHPTGKQRKMLIDVCRTRWAARHDSYRHFYTAFVFVIKALEVIAHGLHKDVYSHDVTTCWEGKNRTDASGLLAGLEQFEFIITFLTVYQYLSHLEGITVKLQSTSLEIVQAFHMIEDLKKLYRHLRESVEIDFSKIYDQAIRIADKVDVQPSKPRSTVRMKNRANAPSETVEQYFRRNMAIPFLDHVITELDARFSSLTNTSSTLIGLVPSVFSAGQEITISSAIELYKDDLPSPELIDQELLRWKFKWEGKSELPESCAQAIKECDPVLFPNVFQLLKIACTLLVTSCECERTASTIRRLNTFMRASMEESRLSGLAMIHTHYDMTIDTEEIVDIFAQVHPRKLSLRTLL